MAFEAKYLTSDNDSAFTRHAKYSHPVDTLATQRGANYFNAAYLSLPVGTTIELVGATGGALTAGQFVVTASAAGGVVLALQVVA